ncbi:MAG: hypothetical protein IJ465_00890, partial [Clostridia bacterium]|nr:hypothetical protein [Clostridia bacterium]
EIYVGYCDLELLQKEDGDISDSQVENIKVLRFETSEYRNFMSMVVSLGVTLQKKFGVDLGFEIEEREVESDG